jgi:uncharacterized protein YndB with AHSA1/START domain
VSQERDEPSGPTPLLGAAWKILAALSVFLILVLAVGVALPGTWAAERDVLVASPPDSVFRWLEAPGLWQRWNPWPDIQVTATGPASGEGASMVWDDPYAGAGRFRIVESRPPFRLVYSVDVDGGSVRTRGVFELREVSGGTEVRWSEEGDFGWNPLMGYAALTVHRVQGIELERGLERLRSAVEGETPPVGGALPGVPRDDPSVP